MNQRTFFFIMLSTAFWVFSVFSSLANYPGMETEGKPRIQKMGTIDCDLVETSPVVFQNEVFRFEYVRPHYWNNSTGDSYFRFIQHSTGKATPAFAHGYHLGSAYVFNDTVYVTAVDIWDGEEIHLFSSADLKNWDHRLAFKLPGYGIFNTSMTRADDEFVLMFEIGKPPEEAGKRFTARFATSRDLKEWKILPGDRNYAKDRYTAPHCLRFLDGYFYNFYLEAHEGYETRVVRSRDLIHWEASPFNPVLKASEEDEKIVNDQLPQKLKEKIRSAENRNNSDMDFCEFNGNLIINYSWGNQRGTEFLAEARYHGTLKEFLRGWFGE